MLKTILVGLNWSRASRAAGELSIAWAKQHQARILGVGVVDLTSSDLCKKTIEEAAYEAQLQSDALQPDIDLAEAHRQVDALLTEFECSCLSSQVPVSVVKKEGNAEEVLSRHLPRADLMVVGLSKSAGTCVAAPLSTTLDTVLSNAIHPVVCVPPDLTRGQSIVVAYDGSLQAARTLFAFVGLGLFPNELVRIVAVDQDRGQHAEALALADQYLKAHCYRTQIEELAVEPGGISETLIRHVRTVEPKLVVAGIFGKSWTRSVLCGSVTKRLLHECCAPMFVYH